MKHLGIVLLTLFLGFYSCKTESTKTSVESWKVEIVETEKEFAEMAAKEGIAKAFLSFAANDAVIMRNDSLIIGKEAIQISFEGNETNPGQVSLTWEPDFVDVAKSGDLGYTYGKYVYIVIDSLGNKKAAEGVFHTVWKRQADGKWRFVWD
jgi:ketosteroid isomerase-like protein